MLLATLGGIAWGSGATPRSGAIWGPPSKPGEFPGEALVINANCPDPSVTRDMRSGYWLVCTADRTGQLPLYHSVDLRHWQLVSSSLLPAAGRRPWAASGLWGPTLVHVPQGWRMYVSARDGAGAHHVVVATAPSPAGPWTVKPTPLVSDPEGAIDPSYFTDTGGVHYLLWKVDGNAHGLPAEIQVQELNAAGTGLVGARRELIHSDQPREDGVVEGPDLIRHGGWYYLFYSENLYASVNYAVSVARSRSLAGSWQKHAGPILQSVAPWWGPGGESITTYRGRETVMLWHADWGPSYTGIRRVLGGRLLWGNNGWPHLLVGQAPSPPRARRHRGPARPGR